eukprot:scaffold2006_cov141-Isochrysis_galbana.AAC.4
MAPGRPSFGKTPSNPSWHPLRSPPGPTRPPPIWRSDCSSSSVGSMGRPSSCRRQRVRPRRARRVKRCQPQPLMKRSAAASWPPNWDVQWAHDA